MLSPGNRMSQVPTSILLKRARQSTSTIIIIIMEMFYIAPIHLSSKRFTIAYMIKIYIKMSYNVHTCSSIQVKINSLNYSTKIIFPLQIDN